MLQQCSGVNLEEFLKGDAVSPYEVDGFGMMFPFKFFHTTDVVGFTTFHLYAYRVRASLQDKVNLFASVVPIV